MTLLRFAYKYRFRGMRQYPRENFLTRGAHIRSNQTVLGGAGVPCGKEDDN